MKATAQAPSNIAFIKYWGKKDALLRIPQNPSISMNLSACITTTTVEFSKDFPDDTVTEGFNTARVIEHIDRLREMSGVHEHVRVSTVNNFPVSSGIASSASGFAALTVACAEALHLKLSEQELTMLARVGSGSACRSIPDGFVKWDGEYAYSMYPSDYWDLRDIVVVTGNTAKKISSSDGHSAVETSPFYTKRLSEIPKRIQMIEDAFQKKDFQMFGEVVEEDCLDMHHVMQTQEPPLMYWNESTQRIMKAIVDWRKTGLPAYFTIDAGPNVHLICEGKDEERVLEKLKLVLGVETIIRNKVASGARIIPNHLF